jgi:hypothetical protein
MEDLFANDPAMKCRDSKGRFATPERAYADKAIEENKRLRYEREKYLRAYLSAASMASRWHRKYIELQQKVQALCQ